MITILRPRIPGSQISLPSPNPAPGLAEEVGHPRNPWVSHGICPSSGMDTGTAVIGPTSQRPGKREHWWWWGRSCPWSPGPTVALGLTHLLQGIACFPSVSAAPGLRLLSASTRGGMRWGHSGHHPQGGKQGPSGSWVVALTSLMATVRDEACCQGCPRATCVKPTCLILAGEAYLLHPAVNDPNQLAYLEVRKG